MDEHRDGIAAALELRAPSTAELPPPHERAAFAVPPARLPMRQLPQDAAVALRAVLPAWRAALSAGEYFLEEQMPTPEALKVLVRGGRVWVRVGVSVRVRVRITILG